MQVKLQVAMGVPVILLSEKKKHTVFALAKLHNAKWSLWYNACWNSLIQLFLIWQIYKSKDIGLLLLEFSDGGQWGWLYNAREHKLLQLKPRAKEKKKKLQRILKRWFKEGDRELTKLLDQKEKKHKYFGNNFTLCLNIHQGFISSLLHYWKRNNASFR